MKHATTYTYTSLSKHPALKQVTYFIFKRKNVAVKIRMQLFLSHIASILFAVCAAIACVMMIDIAVGGVATLNIEWIKQLNLAERKSEYAGGLIILLGLAGKIYFAEKSNHQYK
jgi:hypothetical protein